MHPASRVPTAPRCFPLLGHSLAMLKDPLTFLTSLPACGDLVEVRIGPVKAVVICAPDLIDQVLQDDRTFDKGGLIFDRFQEVVGDGVASCPHREHRRIRRLLQPAFRKVRFPGYAQMMSAVIDAVTTGWHDDQVLDVAREMETLTMRISVGTVLSGALPPDAFSQALDDVTTVLRGIYRRAVLPPFLNRLPTPGNRRYQQAHTRLRKTVSDIITNHRSRGSDCGDILSALMPACNRTSEDHDRGLTDTEISDNILTFLIAGTETAAMTLAWALHLVGQHPDVEGRLHAETSAVLAGRPACFEHLPDLEFARHVITETLRIRPPGWIFTRTVTADTRLGEHAIPGGTNIVYSPYLIHHRADIHPAPELFDPGRWDDGSHHPPPGTTPLSLSGAVPANAWATSSP